MECTGLFALRPRPPRTRSARPTTRCARPARAHHPPAWAPAASETAARPERRAGQTTADAGRLRSVHQLGNMRVPGLTCGMDRRQTRAAVEPGFAAARADSAPRGSTPSITGCAKRPTREPYSSKSLLPSTAVVGASASSACRISGPPMSPAWMIWSTHPPWLPRALVGQPSMRKYGYEADNGHDKLLPSTDRMRQ